VTHYNVIYHIGFSSPVICLIRLYTNKVIILAPKRVYWNRLRLLTDRVDATENLD